MNKFNYEFPVRIHFGQGCFEDSLKQEIAKYGERVLLAYGGGSLKRTGLYDRIVKILAEAGKTVVDFPGIMPNPTLRKVQEGIRLAREQRIDLILAVGGGSVSDCCKIVAKPTEGEPIPLGVVVTASGTGSEENNGAVITDEERKVKGAMWGAFADFAILDPDLTKTVPLRQVISGAFDTLSHCMETYFGTTPSGSPLCKGENLMCLSDEINEAVQRSTIRNLKAIAQNPDDDHARSELMWASAMGENGILKLGKQTDFQCHMIEHQLGAYTDCNHGQGLAVLHPTLYRHYLTPSDSPLAKGENGNGDSPLAKGENERRKRAEEKFNRWAQEVWLVQDAEEGIDALEDLIREVGLPTRLSEMGITLDDTTRRAIAESTFITPGCCKQLTPDEIETILKECE